MVDVPLMPGCCIVVCCVSSDLIRRQVPTSRYVLPFSCKIELSSVLALMIPLSGLICMVRLLLESSTTKTLYVPAGTVISCVPENSRVNSPVKPRLALPVVT